MGPTRYLVEVRVRAPDLETYERNVVTEKGPVVAAVLAENALSESIPAWRPERVLVWPAEDQTVRDSDIIHGCLCDREPD